MVTIRTRLFIALFLLIGLGFYYLVDWVRDDIRPRYLETMEESMVDTATVLASLVEKDAESGIAIDALRETFDIAQDRVFAARIYDLTKTQTNLRVYVTDANGIVVYDSDGIDIGEDFSQWNDVYLTLQGKYGARSTRTDPDDPKTSILHVASPIYIDGKIGGALSVAKPVDSVTLFLDAAERRLVVVGIGVTALVIALGMLVSFWLTWRIERLTDYARAVRDGKRVAPPAFRRDEIGVLSTAFEEMRQALENKQYVEEYVQALTHEIKSPLSAIRGAAELLEEDMPIEQRRQFLKNLDSESGRIQDLVDRMLLLSALENRRGPRDVESVDLPGLCDEVIAGMQPTLSGRNIEVTRTGEDEAVIEGERFLMRQAVANLLQNAIDFSEPGSSVEITCRMTDGSATIRVRDYGPGIPDFALDKAFDRFYSLARPDSGKKSSGLGLALVREVAALHGGSATLANHPEGGAEATLILPKTLQ